jgi:hypothetical protein
LNKKSIKSILNEYLILPAAGIPGVDRQAFIYQAVA